MRADAGLARARAGRTVKATRTADYASLAKPRAMSLVVITALTAMVFAGRSLPPAWLVLATLVGGCLTAAGANALNCYLDRDIDALMERTRRRPLPAGRLQPARALAFGAVLTALGGLVLGVFVNWLAAGLALAANLFYVVGYTAVLKRRTPQNIVIGGAAGAAAPLIGWAAVAGGLDGAAFLLAALVLFWTPPHFWALALLAADDYRRAGVPMMPVSRGEMATRRRIVFYACLAGVAALAPAAIGLLGWLYVGVALPLSVLFVALAALVLREGGRRWTGLLFRFSVAYLGLLCLSLVFDVVLRLAG